jgi:cytochrome c biogenesis protein
LASGRTQEVEGFAKYYAELTPAQQLVYGQLGFFDIYHSWYFNALLLVLSLNIILASIDRFPGAWSFISRPKLDASATWLRGQEQHAEFTLRGETQASVAERIAAACRAAGLKTVISDKGGRAFVFAQKNAWNRLGAYAVHVALLTIFTGGFLTAQLGRTGQMPLKPGSTSSEISQVVFNLDQLGTQTVQLPFTVTCTDIQQKLIKKDGPITADNTIDWLTRIKIKDETGEREALVHLNNPFDYRGYRFFQQSFINVGRARNIKLNLKPVQEGLSAQEVSIPRDGETTLADGTRIRFADFMPDFTMQGREISTETGEYSNPAAILEVTSPSGEKKRAFAFAQDVPANAPIAAPVAGYKFHLADFEKVPDQHVLAIQRDPGSTVFYVGSALLILTLCSVFFFSHQRFWAAIESGNSGAEQEFAVVMGANTNRNATALEDRFKKVTENIHGQFEEVKQS